MKTNTTNPILIHQTFRCANRTERRRAMGIETLQLMKDRLTILKLLILLCSTVATTAVFGQTIYVWTNSLATNGANLAACDLAAASNWDPNGSPSYNGGGVGDEMQWDGRTAGNMYVSANNVGAGFSGGDYGLHWHLTGNQTNGVQVFTTIVGYQNKGSHHR